MFQYVLTRRTTKHVGRYNHIEGTIFNNNKAEICSSLHVQAAKQRETRSCTRVSPETKLFIYLGFYVAFNTVQVISRRVVGRAEETSTYSLSGFCTVNCRPTASNYQLSHLRPCRESNPGLRGRRRECYTLQRGPRETKLKRPVQTEPRRQLALNRTYI